MGNDIDETNIEDRPVICPACREADNPFCGNSCCEGWHCLFCCEDEECDCCGSTDITGEGWYIHDS